jgi:beta-1,4-mannosyltransferase
MLNHARELAAIGFEVTLIGYGGRAFEMPLAVRVRTLRPRTRVAEGSSKLAFLCGSAVRMASLFAQLAWALIRERPGAVLVQNPPSFPTVLASWAAARVVGARLLVDWHNYGYSLLGLRLGTDHGFVRLSARHEAWAGRLADEHFCVSEAMRADLAARFRVRACVLYDRPVTIVAEEPPRPSCKLVAVCPAGWTADEDVELLLDALALLAGRAIEVHITGDGPLRERLEDRIEHLRQIGIEIHTGFLPEPDYCALLRRADVGLSLHRSSSRLDLAMKVVDLFGAGVPVCALDYGGSLPEQVCDCVTGRLFRTAGELADMLSQWTIDRGPLERMRRRVREEWRVTWSEEWRRVAAPAFRTSDE